VPLVLQLPSLGLESELLGSMCIEEEEELMAVSVEGCCCVWRPVKVRMGSWFVSDIAAFRCFAAEDGLK
jgi:hypothetical protein